MSPRRTRKNNRMNLTVRHPRDVRLLEQLMKKIRKVDIVLAVTASWCGPCQRLKPVLERVSKTPNQTVPLINVDESVFNKTPFANKVNVSQYPTIVKVGKNGNVTPIERKETLEEDEANLRNIVTAPKSSTAQTFSNRNSLPRASMNSQIKPVSQSPFQNRSSVTLSPPDSIVSETPDTSVKRTTSVQSISNGMPTPTQAPDVNKDIVNSQTRAKTMMGGRMLLAIKKLAKSLTRRLKGKKQRGGEYGLSKTVDAINALGSPEKKRLADYMDKKVPNHGKVTLPSEVASRYTQICPRMAIFEKHAKCPEIKKYVEAGCPAEFEGETFTSNNRALVGGK